MEPHKQHRAAAFALVDLIGVGGCVAFLACAIGPALDVTRSASKQATCLDRLRAIGTATASYAAADPDEQSLPVHHLFAAQDPAAPSFIGAYEWGGKSGIGRADYLPGGGPDGLGSKYGTQAGFGPSTRPLNDLLYPHGFRDNLTPSFNATGATLDTKLDLPAYRCPADDGPPSAAHCPDWTSNPSRSSYDHFGTSYVSNIFMFGSLDGGPMASNSPFLRPLSRVPDPVRTMAYEENIGRWAWAAMRETDECSWIGRGVDPGWSKSIRGWHGKAWTFNHGYVDGHADRRAMVINGTADADGYVLHYLIERVFEDDAEQQYYQCGIIRGDGWQKDTLPDEPIDTGLIWSGAGRPSYEDCVESGY